MIKDLYIKSPEDANFIYGKFDHSNKMESIVSKIRIILSTTPGQVIGDVNFGLNIEDLVFETKINKRDLETNIQQQIDMYIDETSEFSITPKVSFGKADNYDYCVIDFFIDNQKIFGILIK